MNLIERSSTMGVAEPVYRGTSDRRASARAEQLLRLEHAVNRSLAEADSVSSALSEVIHAICTAERWECGRYFRVDEEAGVLRLDESWGLPEPAIQQFIERYRQSSREDVHKPGVGLIGRVWQSGQPLWIAHVNDDARATSAAIAVNIGIRGGFVFPVISQGRTIGVLAFNSREVRAPEERLLEAIHVIGCQIGQFVRRKRADEEQRQFRLALENSADMIVLVDRKTMRLVDVNRTVCTLLGYSREELLKMGPQDLLPESREELERAYDEFIAHPVNANGMRSNYRCRDGSTIPFESTRHVLRSGDDCIIASISRDIRERIAAEEAQREQAALITKSAEQDRLLRLFYDLPFVGLAVTSPSSKRWLQVNDYMCELLGYPREELLELAWTQTTHPDDLPANLSLFQRLKAGEFDAFTFNKRFIRKDGGIIDTTTDVRCVRRADGSVETVVIMVQDISERKFREAETGRLAAIVESSSDAIISRTLDGTITSWNAAAERMFGHTAAEAIGQSSMIMVPPERMEEVMRHHALATQALAVNISETVRLAKDGRRLDVSLSRSPIKNKTGEVMGMSLTLRDISERKRAEAELMQHRDRLEMLVEERTADLYAAKEAAEAANRAKSTFLSNMSHEIRTPMNGVLGMTELLLDAGLNATQRHYAQTIRASGEGLLNIINDILDFSKIEAGRLELDPVEVDVRDLCEEAVQLLAPLAHGKGLELTCHVERGVPQRIRTDPVRLNQVLLNLIGNALKFTEHGEVTVSIERAEAPVAGAQPSLCLIRCCISDSGIGISPEAQARLFKAFNQADGSTTRRFGGTGLGLAVSKQLVELMGGEIGVDSEPGRGSRFWFTIRAEVLQSGQSATPRANLNGMRVLIVEDNATNRTILQHQVAAFGAACDQAADGVAGLEAIRAAQSRGCPYDLALIDMKMPRMTGIELIGAVRADTALRETKLAMLTSMSGAGEAAATRAAGADAYLTKPVRRADLFNALARLTGQTSNETPVVPAARNAAALDYCGAHVLLAEDNPVNQEIARAILEAAGCQVTAADNGHMAVKLWLEQPFDLVLMDCQMPELDGFEAARAIRAREMTGNAHVPIVALTANAMDGDRERCLAAGMDDYLPKPFKRSDLMAMVKRWINHSSREAAEQAAA